MQAKDIPEGPVLEFLAAQTRSATLGYIDREKWPDSMPTVYDAMPPGTPNKVARAKMRALIRRGLVDGCTCGCRGDYDITDKGRAEVALRSLMGTR
jgi:hypothetical protein